ncbi:hypothetical protein [Actinoplanes sp. GCM10030250]|uniref:hypothetical protein n=1 Tax=Actinoplanes sp. GCM10030250 TaxID=3273376 RepID=UPI0036142E4B
MSLLLRARRLPGFAVGLLVVALLAAGAAHWLATRTYFDGPGARVPVVILAPLLAALLLGPTLAGPDELLERSLPVRWRLIRTGHLLGAAAAILAALAAAGLPDPGIYGVYALGRNTLGCIGLIAGAAALLGARLAWVPAFSYVCAVYAAAPARDGGWEDVWAWPVQPSTADLSWPTALAAFTIGATLYIRSGARP